MGEFGLEVARGAVADVVALGLEEAVGGGIAGVVEGLEEGPGGAALGDDAELGFEGVVAEDIQQTLTDYGYDAFAIASSADEAILRASERCPDVVLMDIRIKGERDGIEAASILRERFRVPVVFVTAHADDATIERLGEPVQGVLVDEIRAQARQLALG